MKNICKKSLAILMVITIFTTYVPAINTIVWAIEDVNNEIENQVTEESTNEKKLDTVVEESNTVNKDNESEQLNDNPTEKSKTITEVIKEKSQEQTKGIMQNQEQEVQKTEEKEEHNTKGNTRNLDEDTIINLDEKIIRALNNSYCNYDLNNDGEYSIKELADENLTYLNIECENTTIDLTGVHYMVNLIEIYMYSYNGSIDVSELADLPNLEKLTINGNIANISNLELLTNLKWLELDNYNYNSRLNINNKLPTLENLEYFNISGVFTIDTTKLLGLTKLQELVINAWWTDELLNFTAIGNVTSLEYLTINNYKLDDMSGLDNLPNLISLSIALPSEKSLDTETIKNINSLRFFRIDNFDVSNYQWLTEMNQLQSLSLWNYNVNENVNSEFINILQNLEIENVTFNLSSALNLGELEKNVEIEIDFHDIPLVNALIDSNSRFYNSEFELQTSESDGIENEIRVDNENKKIYLTPGENSRRYEYINGNNGTKIKLQWSFAADNAIPEISDMLKEALVDNEFDTNNDGVLTMAELNNEEKSHLNLFFNNNNEIDLTGIEYLQKLYYLSISSYNKEVNLSYLEGLTNLEELNLSGKFINTNSLKELTGLTSLSISPNLNSNSTVLNDIKDLTNLEKLSLYGMKNESLSPINNLTNLTELRISYNDAEIININEISSLNNLYELHIENVDASDLSGLEDLESLRVLYINQAYDFIDSIDIETLQELNNLEELSIIAIDDLSWVNDLSNLQELTLNGRYSNNGTELTQDYLNMLKDINANVVLSGQFYYNLGNFEVGSEFEQDLNELPLLQEMNNPNSKLYSNSIDIYNSFYGEHEDWSYDSENRVLSITVNEVREYSTYFNISYNSNSGYGYMSLNMQWKGYVNGSKNPVTILDDNLRQELLDNYDIDDDGVITEHDMINASYLELANKNITNITGLQYATNAQWIELSGNKISDVTPMLDLLTDGGCMVYLQNNLIDSLEGIENINFAMVDLSNNYIDFSDESENLQLIETYAENYANAEYEKNKNEIAGISEYRYTEYLKSSIINTCKMQRYGSVEEREDVLEFEDALYNKLIELGFDLNSDGDITKGELSDFCIVQSYYDLIDLSNLGITNIENLKYLANVNSIDLSGNNITDITPLKECMSLWNVNLSNNKIANIEGIKDYFNVNTLNLSNNKIKDITPLQNLRTATSLFSTGGWGYFGGGGMDPIRSFSVDLSNNEVEDVSVLNNLISLYDANLSGNKISSISALSNYDFDALAEGFAIDDDYYRYENVTIDATNNYIDLTNNNNIAAVEHFENYYSTIKTANQNPSEPQYIKGDVNGNGTVDMTDYSMILKHVKGIKLLTGAPLERADVNKNGTIDMTDYSMILKHVKGIKLLN